MKFRTEIEGLRAAAVLPILLFHAGVSRFSGGFVGVDIFFVISGFLITSIIVREMDEDRFTIAKFYKRRALRLFPALFAMLAATMICAALLLYPAEVRAVAKSAGATALFGSNFYFYFSSGYFTTAAESQPLLHTWSLGVEEQFYLFYPIIVLLIRKWKPAALVPAIIAITLASLALSLATSLNHQQADFAFYMLPSRTWQLGLGALIALSAIPGTSKPIVREAATIAGLAMIALSLFVVPTRPGFPAPWALLPCVGTALILACGAGTLGGRLLSIAPARFIGRISYSMYLWHWPIITFYRLQTDFFLSHAEAIALVLATFVVATASYFWIERPFLTRFQKTRERPVLLTAFVAIGVAAALSGAAYAASDRLRSVPEAALRVSNYSEYVGSPAHRAQYREGTCFTRPTDALDRAACVPLSRTRRNVIVVGDSHAAPFWRAFSDRFPDDEIGQVTSSGCRPLVRPIGEEQYCVRLMQWFFRTLIPQGKIDTVVLSGVWRDSELDPLMETIAYLRATGVHVIVLGPSLGYSQPLPMILARALERGDPGSVKRYEFGDTKGLSDRMAARVTAAGARYVPVYDLQCPGGVCAPLAEDGSPTLFDQNHLTPAGAARIAASIDRL